MVLKMMGNLLVILTILMVFPFIVTAFSPGDDTLGFFMTMVITLISGVLLSHLQPEDESIGAMEGLAIVVLGWFSFSVFGALPFFLSGAIPNYIDALFETISGFTTTGATILLDVESMTLGLLFWRSFTHWIGGMGILVFTLALLPALKVGSFQIFKAESPGPISSKIVPRLKDTAKILYMTYIVVTLLMIILLVLAGMPLYEATIHTFGTVGTGGFSSKAASIGHYDSSLIHIITAVFMVISGGNFALYFALFKGNLKDLFRDEEMRLYLSIVLFSSLFIGINLYLTYDQSAFISLRDAFFQTSSIITTTGYATVDFDLWPSFSKAILFILMFVGGCAGSTTGAIKNIRILVLLKLIKREISKIFHPRAIIPVKINDKSLTLDMVSGITSFFALYILLFIFATILITLEGISLVDAASSVAATLGNIGPGFGAVGPTKTFYYFSPLSKILFCALMLLGRLELFTIFAFFVPRRWRNR